MIINGIELDPARCPAVLDTLTWDADAAVQALSEARQDLESLQAAALGSGMDPERFKQRVREMPTRSLTFFPDSLVIRDTRAYLMVGLPDAQRVLLSATIGRSLPPLPVIAELSAGLARAAVSPVDAESLQAFTRNVAPEMGPRPAGAVPRLGIGCRQTVTVWPGVFQVLERLGGCAEVIQNSAFRELAPKDFILAPPSGEAAFLPGHGSVSVGHTGSSIEGLWVAGVAAAVERGFRGHYGADLDHIPVRGLDEESLQNAKHLVECGRRYTFFTVDASPLFRPEAADPEGRFGDAVEAAVALYEHIASVKGSEEFDFEFSMDEGPSLSTPEEQEFVLESLTRRGVKVAFVAPNVGFEKRRDYRLPDGLEGLEERVRRLAEQAEDYGALLDFHSGSDKSPATYQTISRACGGKLKLKVSGILQLILAEVMEDLAPEMLREWWEWTLETARQEERQGSDVARQYLAELDERRRRESDAFLPSARDAFFRDFSFAMVGAKDATGAFLHRSRFYPLPPAIQDEYTRRVVSYVTQLAEDLGLYG
jgi:hypothetical protein